ncbi:MAG: PPC domain-containing protein, partial [Acidobacteria bacterium]|nr:PPC domain-containing protein [Acidobacteriota bacterium]
MTIAFGDLVECDINPVGDVDLYRFSGASGETVRIQATQKTGPGTPYFELYDPGNVKIAERGNRWDAISALEVQLTGTGTYTIRVYDADVNETMGYRIFLQRLVPPLSPAPM